MPVVHIKIKGKSRHLEAVIEIRTTKKKSVFGLKFNGSRFQRIDEAPDFSGCVYKAIRYFEKLGLPDIQKDLMQLIFN
jgi:hypothetical protein